MTDLQRMLIAHEGMELKPYVDSVGKLTIGVGRNLVDKGISREEALMMLTNDMLDAINDVRHCCSVYDQLSAPRKAVMVSMAFNMGRDGLAGFVRFLNDVHRGDWEGAAGEMLQSKWAGQVGQRAITLSNMMRNNVEFHSTEV